MRRARCCWWRRCSAAARCRAPARPPARSSGRRPAAVRHAHRRRSPRRSPRPRARSRRSASASDFVNAGVVSPDTISPGDTLSVRVWENVDTGLLAGVGQKATPLEAMQVDQARRDLHALRRPGQAAGRSPDQLRQDDHRGPAATRPPTRRSRWCASPATARRSASWAACRRPGVYPIEAPTRRLSAMLARAGGVALVPDVAQIKIERGGRTGRDLAAGPLRQPALRRRAAARRPDHRRGGPPLVHRARRQHRPGSGCPSPSATCRRSRRIAAPAASTAARPIRPASSSSAQETPEVANRVLGRADLVGPQRMAYLLDLTRPEGLFSAREFVIRDEDTIYITEAPFASWTRVLAVATAAVSLTDCRRDRGVVERPLTLARFGATSVKPFVENALAINSSLTLIICLVYRRDGRSSVGHTSQAIAPRARESMASPRSEEYRKGKVGLDW